MNQGEGSLKSKRLEVYDMVMKCEIIEYSVKEAARRDKKSHLF